jgi:GNAT superfamily N-acetyltransferase
MNKTLEASRILMTRQSCENFPVVPVPEGFTLCWYAPGFEKHWLAIHLAAEDEIPITPELFTKKFGSDPKPLADRQCYLFSPEGAPAGTITAWFDPSFEGANYGRLHFLAVHPRFQRRGLAKVLMSSALQKLKVLGHQRAYLATSSKRISAIRIYLYFGFIPLIKTAEDQALWQQILRSIELGTR